MATSSDTDGLVVIGGGLMRTGTNSLQVALQQLLGGKCYHGLEILEDPATHCKFWYDAADKAPSDQEWRRFFSEYKAAVDFPAVAFYKELMEVFPNAKVVLTVRDPHRWFKSVQDTVANTTKQLQSFPLNFLASVGPWRSLMPTIRKVWMKCLEFDVAANLDDEAQMVAAFNRHVEEVKRHVPADRLLVFEAKDGWQPLCDFLGVPVPPHAYPHVNTTDDFNDRVKKHRNTQILIVTAMLALVGAIGYALYHREWSMALFPW